jgi:hypothetical protein
VFLQQWISFSVLSALVAVPAAPAIGEQTQPYDGYLNMHALRKSSRMQAGLLPADAEFPDRSGTAERLRTVPNAAVLCFRVLSFKLPA